MALSDPLMRNTIRIGQEPPLGKKTEFMDTPFAKEPNRISTFSSIKVNDVEFEVFDDVWIPWGGAQITGRITEFFYHVTIEEKEKEKGKGKDKETEKEKEKKNCPQ